ncbi:myg1 protein [Ophiostoma piceae UAMH 11346]|uniref:Myg1 protein n=1 Tax=Ophiostoma piceae (strain UAMH 11346) TaxID=1262450 RepID=S3C8G3_OPHP1|nr:myg1 protein [Ophiostoma piceae UAMH 11346]
MADQAAKRLKTDSITVATHNGHFHADEALAVHMLRRHVPEYAGAALVRTRNPAVLATSHTVVDVGGEYDAAKLRFDHHQRGFTTTFPGRATKLSSAGLVYMHFGRGIIERSVRLSESAAAAAAAAAGDAAAAPTADADIDMLYNKLYAGFIEALDAHDNGIDAYDPAELAAANNGAGIAKRFTDGSFTLGAVVGRYNANWNDADQDQASEDARFEKASARIGEEFDRELNYLVNGWLPARSLVQAAFEARTEFDSAGRLLVFRSQSCPWKDHLYTKEAETEAKTGTESKVVYVLYPDNEQRWRVQCVPAAKDSFTSRKPLPEAWRGHRDGELDKILEGTVEPGAVFVHAAGFIGGHRTFEGALAMAKKALEL